VSPASRAGDREARVGTKLRTRTLFLALALVLPGTARAAEAPAPGDLGRPALRVFTDADGLPHAIVQGISEDAAGRLWVATQDGAARYDGHAWTVVDMPGRSVSNYVRTVLPSRDGGVWFGRQEGGLARLLPGATTAVDANGDLPVVRVNTLMETVGPDGALTLWAGTHGSGVARLKAGKWTVYRKTEGLPDDRVWKLSEVKTGDGVTHLVAGTEAGLAELDGAGWKPFLEGLVPPGGSVNSLLETDGPEGHTLWVGVFGVGIYRIRGGLATRIDTSGGLPSPFVTSLAATVAGDGAPILWVGTTEGAARLAGGRWSVLGPRRGLPATEVYSLFRSARTPAGPLWIGTRGGGLARLHEDRFVAFDKGLGLPGNQIYSLRETGPESDPVLWAGTSAGAARLSGGQWTVVDASSGLPGNQVSSIVETVGRDGRGTTWVGTTLSGIGRFDGARWTTLDPATGLFTNRVSQLLASSDDDGEPVLWVASDGGGLGRLHRGAWTRFTKEQGLPGNGVNTIFETRGLAGRALWAGTRTGAVRIGADGTMWRFGRADGLPSDDILGFGRIDLPGGRRELWVGTRGGIARRDFDAVDRGEPGTWRVLSDASSPALPSNAAFSIRQDHEGSIWLGTNKGVVRLRPKPGDVLDLQLFGTEDGLPSNACTWAAALDRKGRLWVGTMAGIGVVDPARLAPDSVPKPLLLEGLEVNGEPRAVVPGLTLSHLDTRLRFSFALLSYLGERATRFQTHLVGFEDVRTRWTAEPYREVTNLSPGPYTLRVWGRDGAGNVSGPVEVGFRVTPAPWRTWWAYGGYVALLAAAAYGSLRLRLRSLHASNEALEAKVKERTAELSAARDQALAATRTKSQFLANVSHELRTPLNAIIGYSELLLELASERAVPELSADLEKIRVSAQHQLGLVNDVLDISKIEAGRMELHLTRFDVGALVADAVSTVGSLAARHGNRLEVTGAAEAGSVLADATRLRQVLLNLLSNALKFTENGVVTLQVSREPSGSGEPFMVFRVADTGIGLTAEQLGRVFQPFVQASSGTSRRYGGTGLGLALSRRFCQMMGGDIQAVSVPGRGATFTARIPVEVAGPAA